MPGGLYAQNPEFLDKMYYVMAKQAEEDEKERQREKRKERQPSRGKARKPSMHQN